MEKKYNHIEVEKNKNQKWIDNKYFSTPSVMSEEQRLLHPNFADEKLAAKKPFSIILPPPNVTGKLHLGHAWDGYIQDTLIRYNMIDGRDVLWVPGMDHAGIATQAKVEERLRNQGISRYDLGREKFLDKVWEWKEEYATTIREQWGKLGLALNYDAERFTMDEGLSKAVETVFIKMYEDNYIYRGVRAISWDPKLRTVLSNIEVINEDRTQNMYHIKYMHQDKLKYSIIATTRPETLFSDVAVAVHPKDKRYKDLVGTKLIHPITGKEIPVITDDHIEMDKGTGMMKVSAHAVADFEILQKNNLEVRECIDKDGKMNEHAMEFQGMDRFEAREAVVQKLKQNAMIEEVKETTSAVGISERSGEVVEILVQPQWFVNMKPLAERIINDLNNDGVKFHPIRFEDTLRKWMDEIHDWCISRQLWWGHRIPAWYKGEEVKVQSECPGEGWVQDEDVLDTWFSSGLAPFSFLGWPDSKDNMLNRFYPTSVLVTGYDIIFFWVARMYSQSLLFMDKKPFNEVLIHGLIRAEDGRKMSKSLGNGIDPMDVIEQYGSDALRWFLLTNSTPGQDLRFSKEKLRSSWGLMNKLWNISRYILEVMPEGDVDSFQSVHVWIANKLDTLKKSIDEKMKTYDFTVIGMEVQKFVMEDFSSWYIEMTKEIPNKKIAKAILSKLMVILHPFMPFITDEIFKMSEGKELLENYELILDSVDAMPVSGFDVNKIDFAIRVVKQIREYRSTQGISNKETLGYYIDPEVSEATQIKINKLANTTWVKNKDAKLPLGKQTLYIQQSDDMKAKEFNRVQKEIAHLEKEIARANGILSNERFLAKAPEKKIQEEKDKLDKFMNQLKVLKGGK